MGARSSIAWLTSSRLSVAFRLAIGAIFLYAGIVKGLDPHGFAQAIYHYRILPGWLINPMAILLPWVEVVVGVSLLLGVWVPGGSLLASGLLAVFAAALGLNLARGLDIDCGCFSTAGSGSGDTLWYLVRDLGLLAMALQVLFCDRQLGSVWRLLQRRPRP